MILLISVANVIHLFHCANIASRLELTDMLKILCTDN